ncbi:hypothetical protein [Curtobacterium sp. MCBD17_040]|uniref:hypothetical protein n=1 Tax=Curtobacterium sp. MCBD17_040 TaxID=2175674 RepID=UPI000DA7BCC8|nr:hypothetical protein [Curtobacterium sp. MCBD17_040]WIB65800.1 hypothetical protein DEI94_16935 [Curtobacterium sp. MCBD17_040]
MTTAFRSQSAAKAVTLVVVVAGLASAVVHSATATAADQAIASTVQPDVNAWSMPLDAYVAPASDLEDQAEDLLIGRCLQQNGLTDWTVPHRTVGGLQALADATDTAANANPSPALATTKPLDAATAARRGYSGPSTAGAGAAAWKAWAFSPVRNTELSTLPAGTFDRCLAAARSTLGEPLDGQVMAASELAQRLTYLAALDARKDPSVLAASRRWNSCMASTKVRDLPASPDGMPTASMRATDGVRTGAATPTAAEKKIAERDVACQQSSGYRDALYTTEWSRLQHVTTADAQTLAHGSTDNPSLRHRLVATIESVQR